MFDVKPMAERVADSVDGRRFNMSLFAFFAGTALVLAVIGIYGVLAFNVSQRTREVGIRLALGAQKTDVLRSVVGRGMVLVFPGVALGTAAAAGLSRFLQSQLFGVQGFDPGTYLGCAVVLLLTALAATAVPARRAARVQPMTALRCE